MSKSIGELKKYAKQSLSGNYGILIGGMFIEGAANVMGERLASALFGGTDTMSMILGMVFAFAISLIAGLITAGYCLLQLNIARGKEASLANLFYFFRNQPDRVIVAGFLLTVLQIIISIPYYYAGMTGDPGITMEAQINWLGNLMIMLIITGLVYYILSIPFTLTFYIMADDEEISGVNALKQSLTMMWGNMGRYLLLQISFIPWILLSVFTLYIALIWIIPYMTMAGVAFYRDLKGEYPPKEDLATTIYEIQ